MRSFPDLRSSNPCRNHFIQDDGPPRSCIGPEPTAHRMLRARAVLNWYYLGVFSVLKWYYTNIILIPEWCHKVSCSCNSRMSSRREALYLFSGPQAEHPTYPSRSCSCCEAEGTRCCEDLTVPVGMSARGLKTLTRVPSPKKRRRLGLWGRETI